MSEVEAFDFRIDDEEIVDENGRFRFQKKNFKIKGNIWRVHRYDADPFPSDPHAHCIEGVYIGQKLHLGTGEVFDGTNPTGMRLTQKQFDRLCIEVSRHFPEYELPLKD